MFDSDRWQEIANTLSRHKLRSLLTAFGVFWGVFMLVVLLGLGNGMEQGLMQLFKDWAFNSAWIEGGKTSIPYQGLVPGRPIRLTIDDLGRLERLPGVATTSPEKHLPEEYTVRFEDRTGSFEIYGIYSAYHAMAKNTLLAGRLLNPLDEAGARKVAVIGERVANLLFSPSRNPVGEIIFINNVPFRVIGAYTDAGGESEVQRVYIPFSTLRGTFDAEPNLNWLGFAIAPGHSWDSLKPAIMHYLARKYRFDPKDTSAIFVWDYGAQYRQVQTLLAGVRIFIMIVGLGTLAAGCVGVSNIMLVTVKERTREIGIRKAIGATPAAILGMILHEAFVITTVAGSLGLIAGFGLIKLIRLSGLETEYFRDPQVDLPIAGGAFLVLVVAGIIAGLLPALQAVKIQPIEALRHE